jgi:hypothetical protein
VVNVIIQSFEDDLENVQIHVNAKVIFVEFQHWLHVFLTKNNTNPTPNNRIQF